MRAKIWMAMIALGAPVGAGSCRNSGPTGELSSRTSAATTATAASILASAQAQQNSPVQAGVAQSFSSTAASLTPQFPAAATAAEAKGAQVTLPATCAGAVHLQDKATGVAADISLAGALPVAAQTASGYVVYPAGLPSGANVLHRAMPNGTEDFVSFAARPTTAEVDYTVALGTGVAGLRLVAGTLELLDVNGAPRLHVSPPFIVGAGGTRTDGALAVAGCAVDTNASPPWGRAITTPGATTCTVKVTWPDANVTYPAILDPRWTTTGSMATARIEHALVLLSTGKALVAGGRSSTTGTTGLASAELYDQTTGTWAATGSMANGRRLHSMTQLGTSSNGTTSGKVLVAGGISGTNSLSTAELYSPSAGTWIAAGTMDAVRHGHTATLLPDGRVLAAGGLNGTTTLATASLYNPASGAGSWVATTGPIPPGGLKNHTATLIQTSNSQLNNHVLLVGGNNGTSTVASVLLFDPVQNAFSTLASISSPREQHMVSTLQNSNGKILVAGGLNGSTVQSSAIVFDPSVSNGSWASAGTMTSARVGATMTLLPNTIVDQGQVLVAGGSSTGSDTLSSSELFSNTTTWTATSTMPAAIKNQAAVLLGGNMVLLAGGQNGSTVQASAFLYDASFGLSCTSNSQCASGFCTNGVCCDSACNSGTCSACNVAGHLGTCSARISGTVCRASAGVCDVAETCNGTSFTCPSDSLASAGTVCRASTGACDPAETCSGTSVNCPSDSLAAAGTVCRAAAGGCDVAETCNGTSASCPSDSLASAGTVCRASAGACDVAETCSGTSASCPADGFVASGTVCRASAGVCDVAETCSGSSAACPTDVFASSTTVCRASAGTCDVAEKCTGASASCPADTLVSAGTVCRASAGACDVAEACTGSSASCPADTLVAAGTVCRASAGVCDVAETCTGSSAACPADGFLPSTTTCRASAGACDVAEKCTGGSASCPADSFVAAGTVCRAANGVCDVAETCSGSSSACPADAFASSSTVCRSAAGPCDVAENCSGSSGSCPTDGFVAAGTVCRASAGACDVAESCSGSSAACPADGFVAAGTTCRAANGQCDVAETCPGNAASCPADGKLADGTTCNDGNACTQTDTCQSGTCTGSNPVTCTAQDQCHGVGTCNTSTGNCSNPTLADGTTCSDGNSCTTGDTCHGGSCTPGTPSCGPNLAITVSSPITAVPKLSLAIGTDEDVVVPGDPVTVSATATNSGLILDFFLNNFSIQNNGATSFVVQGYSQSLEYFSVAQQAWVPFAKQAYDANGQPIVDPNVAQLTWVSLIPDGSNNTGPNNPVVGTTIAAGAHASWTYRITPTLTSDVARIILDPAQSTGVRNIFRFDTPNSGPQATGDASLNNDLQGVTGDITNVAAVAVYSGQFTSPQTTLTGSATTLLPGDSTVLSAVMPLPAVPPRQPGQSQADYLGNLRLDEIFPTSVVVALTAHSAPFNPAEADGRLNLTIAVPRIDSVSVTAPAQQNAGLTIAYSLAALNDGHADAGPFTIQDNVDGNVAGNQVIAQTVTAGTTGTLLASVATSLSRPPGSLTDNLSISWKDRNGDVYGPIDASFSTTMQAGHPEGYLLLAGASVEPALLGTSKTLTATIEDGNGNPVAGKAIQFAVTGVNAQTMTITTGADGTATFTYSGANLGTDSVSATGTVTGVPLTSTIAQVQWVTSVGTPCAGRTTPLDIVFVIDGSPSMFGDTLTAVQTSTKSFIDQLDFSQDRVAIVEFSGDAHLILRYSNTATAAKAGVDAAVQQAAADCPGFCLGGTNIPGALDVALAQLGQHRSGAEPVLVFLSDGGNTGADPSPELAQLRSSGTRSVVIGIGSNIDPILLRQIATSANDYFFAPSASEIAWAYGNVTADACRTLPPLVSAGGNPGLYSVQLPTMLTLQGEAHGGGEQGDLRLTTQWTQLSGPAPVTFADATSPVTDVVFTLPGTYVLQLSASDGFLTTAAQATITVDPAVSLDGASVGIALSSPGPIATGTGVTVTATLLDAQSHPITAFPVQLTVAGVNPQTAVVNTNASGVATFAYVGASEGTDLIHVTALGSTTQPQSATLSLTWTPGAGAIVTGGWIASPTQLASVGGRVPIVLANNVTLSSGTVSYWPATAPAQVHTLTSTATGSPGATIATLDTTMFANGTYIVDLNGTDNAGHTQESAVALSVAGEYKPGRKIVEVVDFTVPLAGIPITVGRRYDSLEKDKVSDFGHGWSLLIGNPKLEVDPGHNVSLTMPDGKRVSFFFGGTAYPFPFNFLFAPSYVPEAGVFGALTSDGCDTLIRDGGQLLCFLDSGLQYAPTTYLYTDAFGRVFTMSATGELKSIKDRTNNVLTFTSTGITSNLGKSVQFQRDGQNRITQITMLDFVSDPFTYTYDDNGDLITEATWDSSTRQYTYDGHLLLTSKDLNGNSERTSTYDADGRLLTDTDAVGNVTHYAYDVAGHTTTITNPDDGAVTQTFDDRGLLLSETDPLGRTTRHQYDPNKNEIKRTDALNEDTLFTYDANGNQTSVTNPRNETTTATYDAFSNPLTSTNPIGNTITFTYDDRGLPTEFADSMGTLATFTSSEHGLPLSVTDAAANTAYIGYDNAGNTTQRTDRLGRTTTYSYNAMGWKTAMTGPRGGQHQYNYSRFGLETADVTPLTTYFFGRDSNGNVVTRRTLGESQAEVSTYDAANRVTAVLEKDALSTKHYTRDFRGNVLTETDEAGRVTTHVYDLAGEIVRTTYPDATFTTQTYDDLGRLASFTDERGNTTTYEYEPGCGCTDRPTKITDPLNRATTMTYDAAGRKTSVTDAAGRTTSYVYDLRGHLVETDFPDSTTSLDTYDLLGRRIQNTDQNGATTAYGYDTEGQLTSVRDALGNVTQYSYDGDGNLSSVTDANNHTTKYTYDADNHKTARTLPLGMSEAFTYDSLNLITAHTDFRGKTTTYTYDALYRLLSKTPDPSLDEPIVTYAYNATGTRASMSAASGSTTTFTYDARDRLMTKATPAGALTYTYDPAGNLASIRSSNVNGTSVDYTWDSANQLVSVKDNRLGGTTTAAYTPTGRPSTLSQPNGVGATYTYDGLDRIRSMAWERNSAPAFTGWSYTYSSRGQRLTSTKNTGRQAAYEYDLSGWLRSETISGDPSGGNGAITYTLDSVANRTSQSSTVAPIQSHTYGYNANDELASATYDANGNRTASGGHTFTYDFENHLVSQDGNAVTVSYDGNGDRSAKTVAGATTQYLTDDRNPTGYLQVLEEVSGGAVATRYTYAKSIVSQTRDVGSAPITSFYGYDAQGNIAFLTDTNGVTTDTYDYDAWGNIVRRTGATANTRVFDGEEIDQDLGLINLRARQYDVSTGRFTTVDPLLGSVRDPISMNRYLFAHGDPLDRYDPSGRGDDALTLGIILGAVAAAILVEETIRISNTDHSRSATLNVQGTLFATGALTTCNFARSLTIGDALNLGTYDVCEQKKKCFLIHEDFSECIYECGPLDFVSVPRTPGTGCAFEYSPGEGSGPPSLPN
jgi:RHS repeat-associated protein